MEKNMLKNNIEMDIKMRLSIPGDSEPPFR